MQKDIDLIDLFVCSFEKLDVMSEYPHIYPITGELRVGEPDESSRVDWRPRRTATSPALLDPLYAVLPARFPPLYEQLVLSYRWAQVDLESFSLMANPPGPDLGRLMEEITRDRALWENLIPCGYIQFGRGPDMDYDPVCFDVKSRMKNGDCKVVKVDHEEILCNSRVRIVAELAPSFEQLVVQTIERANSLGKQKKGYAR